MYSKILQKNAEAVKVIFVIINVLGSSPYNPNLPKKYRYLPIIYSVLLVIWFTLQIIVTVYYLHNMKLFMSTAVLALQKLCESLVPILVVCESLKKRGKDLQDLMEDAIYADQCLLSRNIQLDVNLDEVKKMLNWTFKCISAYTLAYIGTLSYIVITLSKNTLSLQSAMLLFVTNNSHVVYNIYLSYYYWVTICCYQSRFRLLNDEIRLMMKPKYGKGKNVILVKPVVSDKLKKIKTIRLVHAVSRELMARHNTRHGVVIALQYFQCVIAITVMCYVLLCMINNITNNYEQTEILVVAVAAINIFHCFFVIIFPTTIHSAKTSFEANHMESIVHELMSETYELDLFRELEDFSLELLHGKVVFTAYGFFDINYTTFTKIAGAVISYVVIFMQFGTFDYHDLLFAVSKNEANLKTSN